MKSKYVLIYYIKQTYLLLKLLLYYILKDNFTNIKNTKQKNQYMKKLGKRGACESHRRCDGCKIIWNNKQI